MGEWGIMAANSGSFPVVQGAAIMDPSKFLQSFNAPDAKLPTGHRDVTQVPTQALVMLNDPFVLAMAEYWAHRLVQDGVTSVEERIG